MQYRTPSHRTSADFPADFIWGVATASYQVEGASDADGRKPSIWDTFSRTPGAVLHGHTGDVSVDQYHRYPEDIQLMKELGITAYRFSIAWPRVQPDGSGAVNQPGLDYYRRLTDALHQAGIKAAATLYHWDLPQPLEDAGGWPKRDTAYRFAEYSQICFEALHDHVDMWMTLNEPWCSSVLGYLEGVHAPGKTDRSAAWAAGHHLMLGHGLALQAFRQGAAGATGAPIGLALNLDSPRPATNREEDQLATDRVMDLRSRFFLDPLMGKTYPERHFQAYPDAVPPPVQEGDMELIAQPIDFLGLNFYHEGVVRADTSHPEGFAFADSYHETTAMDWPITPEGLYRHIMWASRETEHRIPLYITENGCAMDDTLSAEGTRCHDPRRIEYLRGHLTAALDAIEDGADLRGYFLWSFIDNFEWALGYDRRFGIVFADYVNQRRIPKDSYYYYREVISRSERM